MEGGGSGFLGFLAFFVVGFLAWLTFLGPDDPNSKNLFICPPPPLGNGKTYSVADAKKHTYEDICNAIAVTSSIEAPNLTGNSTGATGGSTGNTTGSNSGGSGSGSGSSSGGKPVTPRTVIRFEHRTSTMRETDPKKEYVSIAADSKNTEAVTITGWRVGSAVSLRIYTIPGAVRVPKPGTIGTIQPIMLEPGQRLILITGRSPIGQSFETNICTGYLDQYQTFYPSLERACPLANEGLAETPELIQTFGDECLTYLNRIGKCKADSASLPPERYPQVCQEYIRERANYNGCVTFHRNDEDFFRREWRAYLNRDEEVWRSGREILQLYDQTGHVVDTISY